MYIVFINFETLQQNHQFYFCLKLSLIFLGKNAVKSQGQNVILSKDKNFI